MNKRPSIYIGGSLESLITDLKGEGDKTSSIINSIADRYKLLVEQCKPELTFDEWMSLCAAYNGHIFGDMLHEVRAMAWMCGEWIKYNEAEASQFYTDNLVEKVKALGLVEKVEALGYAERVSILHHVAVFWATGDHGMFENEEVR